MHSRPNDAEPPPARPSFAVEFKSCASYSSKRPVLSCSAWLDEFNFPQHDDGFFIADVSLIYRPSVPFIN